MYCAKLQSFSMNGSRLNSKSTFIERMIFLWFKVESRPSMGQNSWFLRNLLTPFIIIVKLLNLFTAIGLYMYHRSSVLLEVNYRYFLSGEGCSNHRGGFLFNSCALTIFKINHFFGVVKLIFVKNIKTLKMTTKKYKIHNDLARYK